MSKENLWPFSAGQNAGVLPCLFGGVIAASLRVFESTHLDA